MEDVVCVVCKVILMGGFGNECVSDPGPTFREVDVDNFEPEFV